MSVKECIMCKGSEGKIRKSVLEKEFDREEFERRRKNIVPYAWKKSVQLREKRSVLENRRRLDLLDGDMGNHAVMTPTTIAANAPRALKTFLDPELLLVLLPLVLEELGPLAVPLGEPEEETPGLGVEVESG
jgi:hypothetical protein